MRLGSLAQGELVGISGEWPEWPQLADVLSSRICVLRLLKDGFWIGEEAAMELVVLLGRKEEMVPRLESVGFCEVEDKLRD